MKTQPRIPSEKEQKLVDSVQVRPIRVEERIRCMRLLKRHHYLGALQLVGEQILSLCGRQSTWGLASDSGLLRGGEASAASGSMDWLDERATAAAIGSGGEQRAVSDFAGIRGAEPGYTRAAADLGSRAPRCTHKAKEIRSLVEHLKRVPDFRSRIQSYPVWSLLAIVALAYLCGAPRGQKDLAKFARQMSGGQRRALGIRRNRRREFPAPTQPTFSRLLKAVNAREVEAAILAFQHQVRGPGAPRRNSGGGREGCQA